MMFHKFSKLHWCVFRSFNFIKTVYDLLITPRMYMCIWKCVDVVWLFQCFLQEKHSRKPLWFFSDYTTYAIRPIALKQNLILILMSMKNTFYQLILIRFRFLKKLSYAYEEPSSHFCKGFPLFAFPLVKP